MKTEYKKQLERLDDFIQHMIQQLTDGEDGFGIRKRRIRVLDMDHNYDEGPRSPTIIGVDEDEYHTTYILSFSISNNTYSKQNWTTSHKTQNSSGGDGYIEIAPRFVNIESAVSVRITGVEMYNKHAAQLDSANEAFQTKRLSEALDFASKSIGYDRAYKLKNLLD